MSYYDIIQEAKIFVQNKTIGFDPKVGLILGTGLGSFVDQVEVLYEVPFRGIPHFPATTVQSHRGKFLFAKINGTEVLIQQGRYHYYEGHDMQTVTLPVRIMQSLGIQNLIVTNAAGGLNPDYQAGDIVLIKDHINLHSENPLRGANDERLGIRFPDMSDAYNSSIRKDILNIVAELNLDVHEGVYAGLSGPNLETPAEYNYLNTIGGDLVGMSTIPEVIVARHADIKVAALSIVSNVCYPPQQITKTTVEEVISVVENSAKDVFRILKKATEIF